MRINCHCHIFSLDCVPLDFKERFGLNLRNPLHWSVHWAVKRVLPKESIVRQYLEFADQSIGEIADRLVQEMDEAEIEIATPLMMDMEFCPEFRGVSKSFEDQLKETCAAAENVKRRCGRPRLLPFVAADPRREGIVEIVREAIQGGVFKGVKIYPVMGYLPDNESLFPVYEFCRDNQVPITTHCENGGVPGFEDYYRLAHPTYWVPVLKRFPELKLNLAHNDCIRFPWQADWQGKIADLILEYPNVYTDLSCDFEMVYRPRRYFRQIKRMLNTPKIRDRVLYGTDWYMGRFLWTEVTYLRWFEEYARKIPWCRVEFTETEMKRLTEENPKRFLGL
jgi:predicted TIM-barrel fold metal-dependent hydrolase